MNLVLLTSFLCTLLPLSTALDSTRLIYEFPNNTWVENLVVRPNGSLLLTIITTPDLYLLDPFSPTPKPELVHRFSSNLWLCGITETSLSTYYVLAANATYKDLSPTPGSNHLYRIHFSHPKAAPQISLAATIPQPVFLNSLITLNPTTLLASDSTTGAVWALNPLTGTSRIVIRDPLMAPNTTVLPVKLGINGIKLYRNHTLYFTNSEQALLATIPINPLDGTATGPARKLASALNGGLFDDFALDGHGNAFVASPVANAIVEVRRDGTARIIAGRKNSTEIAEPTAAQFGRTSSDADVLYVTTAGGLAAPVNGGEIIGGQVVAVKTGRV